jgi:hypothetical protein
MEKPVVVVIFQEIFPRLATWLRCVDSCRFLHTLESYFETPEDDRMKDVRKDLR